MGWIALEGMRFFAYHGVHPAEQVLGTDFEVDVLINFKTKLAAEKDDVEKTINYETVYQIVRLEMETPSKLLETVAQRIIQKLKYQFQNMDGLKVYLRKYNPPLGAAVRYSGISEEEDYLKECPRCAKNKLTCYGDETCWCRNLQVHPATKEAVKQQYKRCICPECLKFFAG